VLPVRGPNRSPGGYYRTAAGRNGGPVFGGVPMQATEDAVVAAVRAGYRIVDAQIERGMRIAEDLRGAARRAGVGEASDMLASAESLARRSMLLAIDWLETLAAQPSGPLTRILNAQYRLLGSLVGLDPQAWKDLQKPLRDSDGQKEAAPPPNRGLHAEPASSIAPRILFEAGMPARAVEVIKWQIRRDLRATTLAPLKFLRIGDLNSTFGGTVELDPADGVPILRLRLSDATAEGQWKAPICSQGNELLGIAIVEL
jgi:hypothetical protein